jgi:hypothetical protein
MVRIRTGAYRPDRTAESGRIVISNRGHYVRPRLGLAR